MIKSVDVLVRNRTVYLKKYRTQGIFHFIFYDSKMNVRNVVQFIGTH